MPDEAAAWKLFEQLRWGGPPEACPHCAATGRCYYLQPARGLRRTRHGRTTQRRIWKCGACRRQFSVLTGTVFEGSRISLVQWLRAVEAIAAGARVLDPGIAPLAARRHMEFVVARGSERN